MTSASLVEGAPAPSHDESVGWPVTHVIDGKYEVKALIGKGGMGTVYRMRHWEWNVDLAVKVPLAHLVSDRINRERFVLEAQTWIDLGVHPNIVQCWFVREWEGLPLLFLDYLSQGSLKDWRKAGRVKPGDWAQIIDLMIQACSGLGYAHEFGLVHRDVKPANFLMRDDGGLCVTDFGLVKLTQLETEAPPQQAESVLPPTLHVPDSLADGNSVELRQDEASILSSLALTRTGTLLGTPEYGAPEQWTQARGVGTQADIYALGVILFELCCGRRPFDDGHGRVNSSLLVGRHISKPPPDPRQFNQAIPPALAEIILHCLQKRPDQRPATMLALREVLEKLYRDVVGKAYPRALPRAGAQRADALNNKAVSLWNLGFQQSAFDAWRDSSKLDALHPETVYNRSVLQWREGQIDEGEVLRRLTQVKAAYPHLAAYLGYFHLDRFSPREACEELEEALNYPLAARNGSVWRALGDARMYLEEFIKASKAYEEALQRMPDDREAQARLKMAKARSRQQGERTRFPLSGAQLVLERRNPITAVALSQDGLYGLNSQADRLEMWELSSGSVLWTWRADNPDASTSNIARLLATPRHVLSLDSPKGRVWSLDTGQVVAELQGRKRFLAVAPDQQTALAGSDDLELVSLPEARLWRNLVGHSKPVSCAAYSPDGRVALSGSGDRQVRVWDLESGECLHVLEGHTDLVETVVVSPDGTLALSGGRDRTLRVWLLATGDCLYVLEHADEVRRLRITADSRYVVASTWSAAQKESLEVWNLANGGRLFSRPGGTTVALLSGGPWALVGSRFAKPGTLHLWDIPSGRLLRTLSGHAAEVGCLALSPGDRWALSGSADGSLRLWEMDWASRVFEASLVFNRTHGHTEMESTQQLFVNHLNKATESLRGGDAGAAYRQLNAARQVAGYIRDPRALALNAELIRSLQRTNVRAVWQLRSCTSSAALGAVALTRDGAYGVSAAGKILHLWELSSGSCLRGFTGHSDLVKSVCVSSDGLYACSGSLDGSLRVWNLRSGDCVHVLKSVKDDHTCVAVSEDGHFLVSTTGSQLQYWNLTSGELIRTTTAGTAHCLAISADAKLALTASELGLRLTDLSRGEVVRREESFRLASGVAAGKEVQASALTVSPDGRYAVVACPDHGLSLWNLDEGMEVAHWGGGGSGHSDRIQAVQISADGRVAISASRDGTLRVWDVANGVCLETIGGDAGPMVGFSMTPDGRFALSAGEDLNLRLWELDWELNPDAPAASLSGRKSGLLDRITSLFRRRR